MSNLSHKDLISTSIQNLTDLLENDDVTVYPKTLRVIASILDQRAKHIEMNLECDEQVFNFNR
ncbi:hypothetical protein N9V27_01420 [bacterium]|jgi:hypothetical protein|nr:hypothetical protein [bacterium]